MKILKHRIVASALGAAGVLGFGWGIGPAMVAPEANAQVAARPAQKGAAGANGAGGALAPWTALHGSPQSAISTQGMWAEVISSTSRWIVVQNQEGQQFPIAGDRIHQFLVRWPSSVNELTARSMIEATGMQASSNSMMTDHIDVYEDDAQNLVTPTLQNIGGQGQGVTAGYTGNFGFINYQSLNFGSVDWTALAPAGAADWTVVPNLSVGTGMLHVVGQAAAHNPVTLTGFGPGMMMVMPGSNGMSVTQVTLGTNSYAKKGDLVHMITESALPRGLDVNQLVLYKKIRLREFQP